MIRAAGRETASSWQARVRLDLSVAKSRRVAMAVIRLDGRRFGLASAASAHSSRAEIGRLAGSRASDGGDVSGPGFCHRAARGQRRWPLVPSSAGPRWVEYVRAMSAIDEIRSAFAKYRPQIVSDPPGRRAAVAIALCESLGDLQVLFIERASREGDPWSGHMAFPGGRVADTDLSPQAAAQRETLEEVGLSLADGELLGRLDDSPGLPGTSRELVVSAFVFHVTEPPPLVPNHEVRETFWFPVESLLDSRLHIEHPVARGTRTHFPGILVGEPGRHVVWGLTYRFLVSFLQIIGQPLPERWKFDRE